LAADAWARDPFQNQDRQSNDIELIGTAIANRKSLSLLYENLREAENAIIEKLSSGQLQAWGIRNGEGDLEKIPSTQWAHLRFHYDPTYVGPCDQARRGATRWTGVVFNRKEVLNCGLHILAPRQFSAAKLREWLAEHHAKLRESGEKPSDRGDYKAAKQNFPGVSRDALRAARRQILPPDLLRPGRRLALK
jgi:hypothetical protein